MAESWAVFISLKYTTGYIMCNYLGRGVFIFPSVFFVTHSTTKLLWTVLGFTFSPNRRMRFLWRHRLKQWDVGTEATGKCTKHSLTIAERISISNYHISICRFTIHTPDNVYMHPSFHPCNHPNNHTSHNPTIPPSIEPPHPLYILKPYITHICHEIHNMCHCLEWHILIYGAGVTYITYIWGPVVHKYKKCSKLSDQVVHWVRYTTINHI